MKNKLLKICLVSSRGGHLYQLYLLRDFWGKHTRFWVTGNGGDVDYLLRKETIYRGHFSETRNVINAMANFVFAFAILSKEKPNLILSTGAGIAPPFVFAGKLLGIKSVFIDSISFIHYPSLSAKIISVLHEKVIVQHKNVVPKLTRASYWGSIL